MGEVVTDAPEAPKGVEVRYPDGSKRPLEVYYVGMHGGKHTWKTTSPVKVSDGGSVFWKDCPPNTRIVTDLA